MKSIIFWDMAPCSPLSCTRRFGGMSGATQQTTWRHIPEDDTLQEILSICVNYAVGTDHKSNIILKRTDTGRTDYP
jgi:hypothetical protein